MKTPAQPMEKVTFQLFVKDGRDGFGSITGIWQDQFSAFVSIDFREGKEEVVGGAWYGKKRGILTIRNTSKSREIERTWRLMHRGTVFQIKEPPRTTDRRTHISIAIEGAA